MIESINFKFIFSILALQLSVQEGQAEQSNQNDANKVLGDQSFMSTVLAGVSLMLYSSFCGWAELIDCQIPI